jgi:hypothetical protein
VFLNEHPARAEGAVRPHHVKQRVGERISKLRAQGYASYNEYLRSRHWRRLRIAYRESDLPQECVCGEEEVQYHHTTYERIGAERLTDLTPLCARCHQLVHVLEWQGLISLDLDGLCDEDRAIAGRAQLKALVEQQARQARERLERQQREVRALPVATRLLRAVATAKRRHVDISHNLFILKKATREGASARVIVRRLLIIEEAAYGWEGWRDQHTS